MAKRSTARHAELARGDFNQRTPTMSIHGSIVGILGFGGIEQECTKLFRPFGAQIHAIALSAKSGTAGRLEVDAG